MGRKKLICLLIILVLPKAYASADSIWIQSGSGNPIELGKVTITGIQDELLVYSLSSGESRSKPLAQVPQIKLDDEPAFSTAEEAFKGGDFRVAADNYRKALSTTTKAWLKERCALRLVQAADKSNNFPDAVAGFVELLQVRPAL